ncbi:MAG: DUF3995 domain-containing protein [Cytophagaceae bacterium]|nr:DUF3995 domain-containing protein [Gemmatimonadaceae bacterium]
MPPMLVRGVALALGATLAALSALHVYWAVRGVGGGAAIPTRADGSPVLRPGVPTTLAVAALLALACLIVLGRAGAVSLPVPPAMLRVGTWGICFTFVARTIGDFRYAGIFRRVKGTPFARWDARLFTPLCAAMAAASAVVAWN